jgi:hypothetical protein
MIGYISLIYAFLGDFFIFDVELDGLQAIGVSIVLVFSISMIIYNCKNAPKKLNETIKRIERDLLLPEDKRAPIPAEFSVEKKVEMVSDFTKSGI